MDNVRGDFLRPPHSALKHAFLKVVLSRDTDIWDRESQSVKYVLVNNILFYISNIPGNKNKARLPPLSSVNLLPFHIA